MVHEEEPIRKSIQIAPTTPPPRDSSCTRPILHPLPATDRGEHRWQEQLRLSLRPALHDPSCQARYSGQLCCYDRPTDGKSRQRPVIHSDLMLTDIVRNQHHWYASLLISLIAHTINKTQLSTVPQSSDKPEPASATLSLPVSASVLSTSSLLG